MNETRCGVSNWGFPIEWKSLNINSHLEMKIEKKINELRLTQKDIFVEKLLQDFQLNFECNFE